MHGTYAFRIRIDPDDDDLAGQARFAMGLYTEEYCNENNWYQEMALVTRDGRVINIAKEDDWWDRQEFAAQLEEEAKDKAWEYALNLIRHLWLGELAWAMDLVTKDRDSRPEFSWDTATETARKVLADYAPTADPWALKNLAQAIHYQNEITWDEPFMETVRPHEGAPAMDLTSYGDGDNPTALLFVDIHT